MRSRGNVNVCFVPRAVPITQEEDQQESIMMQARAAATIPMKKWENELTAVLWTLKQQPGKLQPVRPQVIFKTSFDVKAGHAAALTN